MEEMDFTVTSQRKPEAGSYLVSEPFMSDTHFERSVVLLCEHQGEGSLGYILNHPSGHELSDVLDDELLPAIPVYLGGPVSQNTLHVVHRKGASLSGSKLVKEDVWWGGEIDQVLDQLKAGLAQVEDFKFFLGYSGWAPGQLQEEMESNSWIVSPFVKAREVFDMPAEGLWKQVLSHLGGKYKALASFPSDPTLN